METLDFENDLKQEIHLMYSDLGLKISIRNKLNEMLLDYLTINRKLVRPKPRQVFINPDLEIKLFNHAKSGEIESLKKLFLLGKNVNFFQSKKLFETKFHDHLLYEWNIYHFHLSTQLEKKSKFVKQTNQLLFAHISDEKVIFLDIENHKEGIFADTKWLEILDNHFPEVLEPYKAEDILDVFPNVNSVERQTLWNKGYTLGMTKVNNKIYHSQGIGRVTSGHSIFVTKQANEISRWVNQLNTHFMERLDEICSGLKLDKTQAVFRLQFGKVTLELIEKKSNTILLTYPYLFNFNEQTVNN